jgi:hypothetical protein
MKATKKKTKRSKFVMKRIPRAKGHVHTVGCETCTSMVKLFAYGYVMQMTPEERQRCASMLRSMAECLTVAWDEPIDDAKVKEAKTTLITGIGMALMSVYAVVGPETMKESTPAR